MRQKIMGVALLVACVAIVALALQGTTPEEQDITVVLLLLPLGLGLIFSREDWLHKG